MSRPTVAGPSWRALGVTAAFYALLAAAAGLFGPWWVAVVYAALSGLLAVLVRARGADA